MPQQVEVNLIQNANLNDYVKITFDNKEIVFTERILFFSETNGNFSICTDLGTFLNFNRSQLIRITKYGTPYPITTDIEVSDALADAFITFAKSFDSGGGGGGGGPVSITGPLPLPVDVTNASLDTVVTNGFGNPVIVSSPFTFDVDISGFSVPIVVDSITNTVDVNVTNSPTVIVGNTIGHPHPVYVEIVAPLPIPVTGTVDIGHLPLDVNVTNDITIDSSPGAPIYIEGKVDLVSSAITIDTNITNASLPVTQSGVWNVGVTGSLTIDDSTPIDVNLVSPVPLSVTQSGAFTVGVNNFPVTQPVSGSVSVSNFPVTQPVSGTVNVGNFPGVQPVNGTVATTQSGAWTVGVNNFPVTQAVSGTVAANQSGAWTVGVNNFPATQAVTQSGVWSIATTPVTVSVHRDLTGNQTPTQVKNSSGTLVGVIGYNANGGDRAIKYYQGAGAPTVGTTVPLVTIGIEGNLNLNFSSNQAIAFTGGLWVVGINGFADSATLSPGTDLIIQTLYT